MKNVYTLIVPGHWKPCIADLHRQSCGHIYISRINVPREIRGNGYGSQLLKIIIEDADKESETLCLLPVASDGLDRTQLIEWYERYGFDYVWPGRCGMIRTPH